MTAKDLELMLKNKNIRINSSFGGENKDVEKLPVNNQNSTKNNVILKSEDNKKTTIQKNRDIGKLAVSKPKMVQNVINKGTIKEFRCLEQITNPNFSDYTKGASECK